MGPDGSSRRNTGGASNGSSTQPVGGEPGSRAKNAFTSKPFSGVVSGRVVDRLCLVEMTTDAKSFDECDQLRDRVLTHRPDAAAGAAAVAGFDLCQLEVGLLEQESGACGRTAAADEASLDESGSDAC